MCAARFIAVLCVVAALKSAAEEPEGRGACCLVRRTRGSPPALAGPCELPRDVPWAQVLRVLALGREEATRLCVRERLLDEPAVRLLGLNWQAGGGEFDHYAFVALTRSSRGRPAQVEAWSPAFVCGPDQGWELEPETWAMTPKERAFSLRRRGASVERAANGGVVELTVRNLFSLRAGRITGVAVIEAERTGDQRGDWQQDGSRPLVPLSLTTTLRVLPTRTRGVFDWEADDGQSTTPLRWDGAQYRAEVPGDTALSCPAK